MNCLSTNDFVRPDEIDHSLKCPIAFGVINDPIRDQCGHIFCRVCFNTFWNTNKKCPVNSNQIGQAVTPDKETAALINDLEVFCQKKDMGCDWKGRLKDKAAHTKNDCSYIKIKCVHKECVEEVLKKDLEIHKAECDYTFRKCKFCPKEDNNFKLEIHMMKECQDAELDCEKRCGKKYCRKNKMNHFYHGCELVKHDCFYRPAGCYFNGPWSDMPNHESEHLVVHGNLMMKSLKYFKDFKRVGNELIEKLERTKTGKENKALIDEIKEISTKKYSALRGGFDQKNSSEMLDFIDTNTVRCHLFQSNYFLFFERRFHDRSQIIMEIAKDSTAFECSFSIGLTKKWLIYQDKQTTLENSVNKEQFPKYSSSHKYALFSFDSSSALSSLKLKMNSGDRYMLSFDIQEANLKFSHIDENKKVLEEVKMEFINDFFEWQPVIILSGQVTVKLLDWETDRKILQELPE